ncbi:TolC family protein [Sphingobacterium sp. HJSM2_6]|uniref:TolC family protein n=1 Tax=Sphingobacterium sp. HJSM2_6 TaxID=3366264 RepID=UPI003BE3FE3E
MNLTVLINFKAASYLFLLVVISMVPTLSKAQDDLLRAYIQHGLDSNLVVLEKNISMEKALNGLAVARSYYLPQITADVMYTHAEGGRSINLPIGDLINPIYTTLNQLTNSQSFPQITNEQINFLPKHYYDAKVRTSIPLLNTDIKHQKRIQEGMLILSQQEVMRYKRELVKDIKIAYYNYLSAIELHEIYGNALELAKEGRRVNEKLLEAGKGLPAYVIRANAEIAQHESKLVEAEQQIKNARSYFNMLLNRRADTEIKVAPNPVERAEQLADVSFSKIAEREEIQSLTKTIEIQETLVQMSKQVYVPKLNAFLDVGAQSEGMRLHSRSPYVMVGAQLKFPIFEGNRNKLKIQEQLLTVAESTNKLSQVQQQLEFSEQMAKNELEAMHKNFKSTQIQVDAASTYQRLIVRGFNEGVNTYLETIDARTQLTQAKMSLNIAAYKLLAAQAKLEREQATFPIQ